MIVSVSPETVPAVMAGVAGAVSGEGHVLEAGPDVAHATWEGTGEPADGDGEGTPEPFEGDPQATSAAATKSISAIGLRVMLVQTPREREEVREAAVPDRRAF